jgi:hypothetical protein
MTVARRRHMKPTTARALAAELTRLHAERVARGVCRHCGGVVPCWSDFGDVAVGRGKGEPARARQR